MATQSLFSGSWNHATDKFSVKAPNFGDLRWCVVNNHSYDIPYVIIGEGADKLVFLSGLIFHFNLMLNIQHFSS